MAELNAVEEIPDPVELDDKAALDLGTEVLGIVRSKGLGRDLTIGHLLLARIYRNRLDVWHKHHSGSQSINKVAEGLHAMDHPELSESQLARCINLVEQDTVLNGLDKWPKLMSGHFFLAQVLKLSQQAALFDDANRKALSVRQFRDVVFDLAHKQKPEPKPKENTLANKVFRSTEKVRALMEAHDKLFLDLKEIGLDDLYIKAFHDSFERFAGDVEDLELLLPSLGAKIPDDLLEELRKRSAKRMEPYQNAPKPGTGSESTVPDATRDPTPN